MMQERDEKLSLQVVSHQAQAGQGPAEQHYGRAIVRNSRGEGELNLLYLFEVAGQCDRLDSLPVKRDNTLPCEIFILAKASEGKNLWGVSLIILYRDGHRPLRSGVQLATE